MDQQANRKFGRAVHGKTSDVTVHSSNITVNKNGGVQLDLNNPETTRKLFDIVDAFRKARPTPSRQK